MCVSVSQGVSFERAFQCFPCCLVAVLLVLVGLGCCSVVLRCLSFTLGRGFIALLSVSIFAIVLGPHDGLTAIQDTFKVRKMPS